MKSSIRGFFSYENQFSKLIHLDIITHTKSISDDYFLLFNWGNTSCKILKPALIELSRSEKLQILSGYLSLIIEYTSFSDMWFLIDL